MKINVSLLQNTDSCTLICVPTVLPVERWLISCCQTIHFLLYVLVLLYPGILWYLYPLICLLQSDDEHRMYACKNCIVEFARKMVINCTFLINSLNSSFVQVNMKKMLSIPVWMESFNLALTSCNLSSLICRELYPSPSASSLLTRICLKTPVVK